MEGENMQQHQELIGALKDLANIEDYTSGDCAYCSGDIDKVLHEDDCPIKRGKEVVAKYAGALSAPAMTEEQVVYARPAPIPTNAPLTEGEISSSTDASPLPEGMVMVPREPTEEMVFAGLNAIENVGFPPFMAGPDDCRDCYDAMIAASPSVQDQPTLTHVATLRSDAYDERDGYWLSLADEKRLAALPAGTKLYAGVVSPSTQPLATEQTVAATLEEADTAEVDALAHQIALTASRELLASCAAGEWCDLAGDYDLDPEVRYLELRGLLERDPGNSDLVRVKEAGNG